MLYKRSLIAIMGRFLLDRKLLVSYQIDDRGLEDIKTFFSKIIIKVVILMKEIIHIQKIVVTHILDILWCHSGGELWENVLCWMVFLHSLPIHFIERNSLVVRKILRKI